jgi:hypothetical protein
MPIDYSKYPKDWKKVRELVLERAGYRCQNCGVDHHAVGYRSDEGFFVPNAGNGPSDCAGQGLQWPSLDRLPYTEAKEFCDYYNCCKGGVDDDGRKWIVIVLTVAHTCNCDPLCGNKHHLKALCQKCHLSLDLPKHMRNAAATRRSRKATGDLFAHGGDSEIKGQ